MDDWADVGENCLCTIIVIGDEETSTSATIPMLLGFPVVEVDGPSVDVSKVVLGTLDDYLPADKRKE